MSNQRINTTQNQQNKSYLRQAINMIMLDIEKKYFEKLI